MKYLFSIFILYNFQLFGDACSAPLLGAAHSGAPGEVNCTGCHSGSVNTGPGDVDYQIGTGSGFYTPGEMMTIVLSMQEGNLNQFGFQTVALRSSDNGNVGTFSLTDPVETRLIEDDHSGTDRIYVGHTVCGADTDTPGSKQWSFQWQAPDQDIGDINIYLSAIATNHNHSTNGDHTYTQVITLSTTTTLLGDLNGDSLINVLDVVQLVGIILGTIDPEPDHYNTGDMNGDGLFNVVDVVSLVNIIIGN